MHPIPIDMTLYIHIYITYIYIYDIHRYGLSGNTVDGRNPAPGDMEKIPLFTWFYASQVVQDFFHQQYHTIHPIYTNPFCQLIFVRKVFRSLLPCCMELPFIWVTFTSAVSYKRAICIVWTKKMAKSIKDSFWGDKGYDMHVYSPNLLTVRFQFIIAS